MSSLSLVFGFGAGAENVPYVGARSNNLRQPQRAKKHGAATNFGRRQCLCGVLCLTLARTYGKGFTFPSRWAYFVCTAVGSLKACTLFTPAIPAAEVSSGTHVTGATCRRRITSETSAAIVQHTHRFLVFFVVLHAALSLSSCLNCILCTNPSSEL